MHAAYWDLPSAYDALKQLRNVWMISLKIVISSTQKLDWKRSFTV